MRVEDAVNFALLLARVWVGLVMFALYLIGCAIGSWLRDWVVSRSVPPA